MPPPPGSRAWPRTSRELALLAYPGASQAVLVPAGVLLVAGLGGLLVAAGRRPLPPARPGAEAS
jgi:hypothetical protein